MHAKRRVAVLMLSLLAVWVDRAIAQTPETLHSPETPVAASSATVVPMLVRYDGAAIQSNGRPKTGTAPATFLFFQNEQGGDPIWTETQSVVFDPSGKYEVYLGSTRSSGLPADLFGSGEARWLEVQIAGETPGPRTLLTSVPYAMKAGDAATLGGLPASSFVRAGTPGSAASAAPGAVADASALGVTTPGGTIGLLPVFTGPSTIGNSILYASSTALGIGLAPSTSGVLDVGGQSIFRGALDLARIGSASPTSGTVSNGFRFNFQFYNSSAKFVFNPFFQFQAESTGNNTANPAGTMNLLYYNGVGGVPKETGLYFNPDGTIHFSPTQTFPGTGGTITGVTTTSPLTGSGTTGSVALGLNLPALETSLNSKYAQLGSANAFTAPITFAAGQTFPGTGTITSVTAGTNLIGGGTTGAVQLSLDTTKIPTLSGNNSYAGSNTFVTSLYENLDVNIDNTNRNPGNISPGLRFGNASGEGMSSKRTAGGNQYGLDLYTGYQPRLSISAAGQVAIGTGAQFSGPQLQVQSAAGTAVQGTSGSSYGVEGTSTSGPGVLGYTVGGTNNTGGVIGQAGATSGFGGIAGVWGDASTHVGVFGSSNQFAGVQGSSTSGPAVQGNSTSGNGVHGVSQSTSGIFGETSSTSAQDAAVYGSSHSAAMGVYGFSSKIGIRGVSGGASQTATGHGTFANGSPAIWGDTSGAYAVVGTADDGVAGEFFNNSSSQDALYVVNNNSFAGSHVADFFGEAGGCTFFGNGDLLCEGTVSAASKVNAGTRAVKTYSVQSAEVWYEDAGSAQLVDGVAHVTLDPTFGQTVNASVEYHVFLTPGGDSEGLYVTKKTPQGFEVHEQHGGRSSISFDYRIMAKPVGHETERLADVTERMQKQSVMRADMR